MSLLPCGHVDSASNHKLFTCIVNYRQRKTIKSGKMIGAKENEMIGSSFVDGHLKFTELFWILDILTMTGLNQHFDGRK